MTSGVSETSSSIASGSRHPATEDVLRTGTDNTVKGGEGAGAGESVWQKMIADK